MKVTANLTENERWWYAWWLVSLIIFVFNAAIVGLMWRYVREFNVKHMMRCLYTCLGLFAFRIIQTGVQNW